MTAKEKWLGSGVWTDTLDYVDMCHTFGLDPANGNVQRFAEATFAKGVQVAQQYHAAMDRKVIEEFERVIVGYD